MGVTEQQLNIQQRDKWRDCSISYHILKLLKITKVNTETFKKHLDILLNGITDTPKIGEYGARAGAVTNIIVD